MWDRQTESWWQQFSDEAIVGSYTGASLKLLPSRVLPYGEFRARWPNGQVLVPGNPGMRAYGRNPYVGYDERPTPLLFNGDLPKGLPAMARVVVARDGARKVAVSMAVLAQRGTLETDGIVFLWRPGQATALGNSDIAKGKDVGSVEVTNKNGAAMVYDVTFAFVLNAFLKDAIVLTENGKVNLATGAPVPR